MKKNMILLLSVILGIVFFSLSIKVEAKEVNIYMFYGKTCPHCEEALDYLNSIKGSYNLNIIKYEVWYNDENRQKMDYVSELLDINPRGVPLTVINNKPIFGYSKGVTDDAFLYNIKLAEKNDFVDKVGIKLGVVDEKITKDKISNNTKNTIHVPFFKDIVLNKINSKLSLAIHGFIDGFSICSLCILLILVCLLINIKDKRKVLALGFSFLISLIFTYLFFILFKADNDVLVNGFTIAKIIISLIVIIFGSTYLNSFSNLIYNAKDRSKNKLVNMFKHIFNKKFFVLSLIGIIILGVLSAIITLYCNDFLILFNNVLSFDKIKSSINLIIYVLCYITPNIFIYIIILMIINKVKINKRYDKFILLISGALLLIAGLIFLLKPGWLMIGF